MEGELWLTVYHEVVLDKRNVYPFVGGSGDLELERELWAKFPK